MLQRLVACGFRIVAFPLYASAIGVRRDSFAALLVPAEGGGLRVLGEPCYLIDGNMSVQVERAGKRQYVWKGRAVEVTPAVLMQRQRFAEELQAMLLDGPQGTE